MKRRLRSSAVGLAGSLLLVLAGCFSSPPPGYQGYVEGEYVQVASSQAGRLDHLMAQKGQSVEMGAPLFALESEWESAACRQAREEVTAAQARLQDLRSGKRLPELEVIRAQQVQAETEARRAAADQARDEAQFQAGGIAQAQLERSRAAAESSAARVRELAGQLAVAEMPGRDEQLKALTAQVAAAQAALEQAEWRLKQKTLSAPVAGRVSDTLYSEGEWVPAGRPVVRLLPPDHVKVRFFVPEPDLSRIAPGQAVLLRIDGRDADIPARVTFIATEAEFTPPIIYSNETRSKLVFMIEAQPLAPTGLHPGQPVQVCWPGR